MEPNRWFKVLVLGGAMLAQSCGSPSNTRLNPQGTGGSGGAAGPDGGASGGAGGTGGGGGGDAGSTDDTSGAGGESASGSGGSGGSSSAGGAAGGGGGSAGGAAGSGGGAGAGGSGGPLQCRISASGHGDPTDPCGCPCCWANDCPNTNTACCAGFCQAGDKGRGCCTK